MPHTLTGNEPTKQPVQRNQQPGVYFLFGLVLVAAGLGITIALGELQAHLPVAGWIVLAIAAAALMVSGLAMELVGAVKLRRRRRP